MRPASRAASRCGGLDAEIPLGEAPRRAARVEGDVLFDEVRFLPGPLAEAIIDLLPNPREDEAAGDGPMLVLRDPISFRIAERKVYQRGLIVPAGPDRHGRRWRARSISRNTLTSWPDSASIRPGPTGRCSRRC